VQKSTGWYPSLRVAGSAERIVSIAGSVLLVKTATAVGLDRGLATALAPWRKSHAVHDPGKILLDLALAVAIGGDCLADIGQARSVPAVFGQVASHPAPRAPQLLAAFPADSFGANCSERRWRRTRVWRTLEKLAGTINHLSDQGCSRFAGAGSGVRPGFPVCAPAPAESPPV